MSLKELTKGDRIKKELRRFNRIFKNLGKDRKTSIQSLIQNAAFMAVTLEDLQAAINSKGVVERYQNGANQWGTKRSPEIDVYNTMIKNYSSVVKQLCDLLPNGGEEEKDALMEFAKR